MADLSVGSRLRLGGILPAPLGWVQALERRCAANLAASEVRQGR